MHGDALATFASAVDAARPDAAVKRALSATRQGRSSAGSKAGSRDGGAAGAVVRIGDREYAFGEGHYRRLVLLAGGKAAMPMARAALRQLAAGGVKPSVSLCVTKDGHAAAALEAEAAAEAAGESAQPQRGSDADATASSVLEDAFASLEVVEASHPVPDARGEAGAARMLQLCEEADERTLVVLLLSGGASALLPAPAEGLTLADLQATTDVLLASGAAIDEVNAVRKHISRVKGGQLAAAAWPATLETLVLSDVVGDPLTAIASGPTVADPTTFADCLAICDRYGVTDKLPERVAARLRGVDATDTPKPGDARLSRSRARIIGSNAVAVAAAADEARRRGYAPLVLSTTVEGEAREVARVLCAVARECASTGRPVSPPACVIVGGETTVTLRGGGRGGRNQEMALAAAVELARAPPAERSVVFLAGGTDGTDGPTHAAGGVVDAGTVARAARRGADAAAALADNDSHGFFTAAGEGFVVTGPTGTNVADVAVVLVA